MRQARREDTALHGAPLRPVEKRSEEYAPVSPAYARYVLGLLFVVYVFNFIDRQVLAILLEAIKKDLGASDTAMGFLSGFAFAVFYTFAGIPIARLADRGSRRSIIALGLGVWSAMTVASGLARSFVQLALARVGVGVGEAAGSPPAHSLISDYFPPERRATALSIYATGVYVGAMLAYLGGGFLVTRFDWRTAFFVVGLPGIPLALLVRLTVRELPRGFSEGRAAVTGQAALRDVLRLLARHRSFLYIVCGAACAALSGYGVLAWGPAFLSRVHGLTSVQIGTWLGLSIGVGGTVGAALGGVLADRLAARDRRWYMRLSAIVCLAAVPFAAAFLLLESTIAALGAFVPFYVLSNMYIGSMLWMTQALVPLDMRATASAILLFALNLVGLGAGPFAVGFLNDQLASHFGAEAIRWSLLAVSLTGGLSGVFFLLGSRTLLADLRSAEND